ncbi:MAG: ABC transporter permease [Clostridia bacterium]|nr:ABC transporter permease [Clostridia bacterium]
MFSLIRCEFKKFKNTYINSLSMLGMLAPLGLVVLMFLINKENYVKSGAYTWDNFNGYFRVLFAFMVGPIITSFVAVFAVFYEYQQKTMKNVVASPHNRIKIMLSKIIYVYVLILIQYAIVAVINILCGYIMGFEMKPEMMWNKSIEIMMAGLATVLLVPFMMFITLLFKSFIPAMVMTVCGTIGNVITLNWEHSYLSPWSIPADIVMIQSSKDFPMKIEYPLASMGIYLTLFMVLTIVYFHRADQNG